MILDIWVSKLSVNGVKCDRTVHYLVATAFHGEQPEGLLIRHLDGRPSNNAPSNLAYGTQVDNMADAIAHDTVEFGERRYNAKPTNEVVIAIRIKKSEGALNKDLAAEYGLTELYIHHITSPGRNGHELVGRSLSKSIQKLDAEARAEVVALRKAGATYEKLREKFGISNTQTANILKKASV
ncbi:HNH endonuclease signature motif containing protein (plasmid) [Klebsiella variicola]|nr:HNH endonuclease signature motif containing protein [Klebsiella variicola]